MWHEKLLFQALIFGYQWCEECDERRGRMCPSSYRDGRDYGRRLGTAPPPTVTG